MEALNAFRRYRTELKGGSGQRGTIDPPLSLISGTRGEEEEE